MTSGASIPVHSCYVLNVVMIIKNSPLNLSLDDDDPSAEILEPIFQCQLTSQFDNFPRFSSKMSTVSGLLIQLIGSLEHQSITHTHTHTVNLIFLQNMRRDSIRRLFRAFHNFLC